MFMDSNDHAATSVNTAFDRSWRSRMFIGDEEPYSMPGHVRKTCTISSDCRTPGSGLRRRASMTENTAVLSPMPRARVSTAIAVNPGFFVNSLRAYRRSCRNVDIVMVLEGDRPGTGMVL